MNEFVYYLGSDYIEGAEIRLIDNLCGEFNTNSKSVMLKNVKQDDYVEFDVELDNGMKFNCKVQYNAITEEWNGKAKEMLS